MSIYGSTTCILAFENFGNAVFYKNYVENKVTFLGKSEIVI